MRVEVSKHEMLRGTIIFILAVAAIAGAVRADYYVDQYYGLDTNDGLSWATAKKSIGAALSLVTVPVTMNVAQGYYNERLTVSKNGLVVLGGYPQGGGSRNPALYPTVIDGQSGGTTLTIDTTSGVQFDGFTFRNGSAVTGGGLKINASTSVVISNNTITTNVATTSGAGVACINSSGTLQNNVIQSNSCSGTTGGGGVLLSGSTMQLISNQINANTVTAANANGGGLYIDGTCTVTMTGNAVGSSIISATAIGTIAAGGGIYCLGHVTFNNNTVSNNQARSNYSAGYGGAINKYAYGGGMYCGSPAVVTGAGNTFASNTATADSRNSNSSQSGYAYGYGGSLFVATGADYETSDDTFRSSVAYAYGQDTANYAYGYSYAHGGAIYVQNSSILRLGIGAEIYSNQSQASASGYSSNSYANSYGGGISINGGSATVDLDGVLVRGNQVTSSPDYFSVGGGIYITDCNANVYNAIIVENNSDGVYLNNNNSKIINDTISFNTEYGVNASGGTAVVRNCILWGNGDDLNGASATYCDISGGDAGTGNLMPPCDPLFVGNGDYHLLPNSCCIDRGSFEAIRNHDFDNEHRPYADGIPDLGADEVSILNPSPSPYVTPVGTPTPGPTPQNYYVDGQTGLDTNNGLSWGTSKATIGSAIAAAEAVGGGAVHVATWTYFENLDPESDIALYGGYSHGGANHDPAFYLTIINGGGILPVIRISEATNVTVDGFILTNGRGTYGGGIYVGRAVGVTISNNVITQNRANGASGSRNPGLGGGVYVAGRDITVSHNEITYNQVNSLGYGGGVACDSGYNIVVSNNTINSNTSANGGAGIAFFRNTTPVLTVDNLIEYNECTTGGGGGVYVNNDGNALLTGNTIAQNYARLNGTVGLTLRGGGIYCRGVLNLAGGNLIDTNKAYTSCSTSYGGGMTEYAYGGGLYCVSGSVVTSAGNTYSNNQAYAYAVNSTQSQSAQAYAYGGGIYLESTAQLSMTNDRIQSNNAYAYGQDNANYSYGYGYVYGGGIYCDNSSRLTLGLGTLVSNNRAESGASGYYTGSANTYGGGIAIGGSSAVVNFDGAILKANAIVANPTTTLQGGGLYVASAPVVLQNTVVAESVGAGISLSGSSATIISCTIAYNSLQGIYASSGTPTVRNCILWGNLDDLDGVSATYSDIQGGDAGTGNLNPPCPPAFIGQGNYHLQPNSCCIDRGSYSGILAHDMDNEPRPYAAGVPDIGADEVAVFNPTPTPFATPPATSTPGASPTPGASFYVDNLNGNDGNNGLSWSTAKKTINAGIGLAAAAHGGAVNVAGAVYSEIISLGSGGSHISLLGGYPPGGGVRNPVLYPTIIDASARGVVLLLSGVSGFACDGFSLINGKGDFGGGICVNYCEHVAITHSVFNGNSVYSNPALRTAAYGAGAYLEGNDILFDSNEVTSNTAYGTGAIGGGVFCAPGYNIVVSNSTIYGNTSGYGGGALGVSNANNALIQGCRMENNQCTGTGGGGAVYVLAGANAQLSGCQILTNQNPISGSVGVTARGGAISCFGRLVMSGNTITGNQARNYCSVGYGGTLNEYASGGAIYCGNAGNLSSSGDIFTGNQAYTDSRNTNQSQNAYAYSYGGAIYGDSGSTVTLSGDSITQSTAYAYGQDSANYSYAYSYCYGGAIYCNNSAVMTIGGKTIIGENLCTSSSTSYYSSGSYSYGGGVYITGGTGAVVFDGALIRNNQLAMSPASGYGGYGFYISNRAVQLNNSFIVQHPSTAIYLSSANATILNCTIADNAGFGISAASSTPTVRNCILWGNTDDLDGVSATYSDIFDGDAGTGNLNPPCNPLFIGGGNYHLHPYSCCIDRGQNTLAPTTDYDGETRPFNGFVVDIGADEVSFTNPTPGTSVTPTPTGSPSPTPAAQYYVDKVNGNDGNNGLSWGTAKKTIAGALAVASSGAAINVARAIYYENLELKSGITLLGGYPVGGGVRNANLNITVIDGSSLNSVILMSGVQSIALDGFTFTHGKNNEGGGVSCYNCQHLAVTNCTFDSNVAGPVGGNTQGAGMDICVSYDVWVSGCTFLFNAASSGSYAYGGCINLDSSAQVLINNNLFSGNTSSYAGGALSCWNLDATVIIDANNFLNNQAANSAASGTALGGAIFTNSTASPVISNNTFNGNWAYSTGINSTAKGGALYLIGDSTVTGDNFISNQARAYLTVGYNGTLNETTYGGAVYLANGSSAVFSSCAFSTNRSHAYSVNTTYTSQSAYAYSYGGIIYSDGGSSGTISHCTMTDNIAYAYAQDSANYCYAYAYTYGGAINVGPNATLTVNQQTVIRTCTASANSSSYYSGSANSYGGAVYLNNSVTSVLIDRTTIDSCDALASPNSTSIGDGIYINNNNPVTLTNDFITNNAGYGIYINTGGANIVIACVTLANNGSYGIYRNSGSQAVADCILWNNGDDLYQTTATYSDIEDGDTGTGDIASNPLFVGQGDFHIRSTSPCKNTGSNLPAPSTLSVDYDGTTRPQETTFDMGADEFANAPRLNLTTYLEGYYSGGTQTATTVTLELRSGATPQTATTLVASYAGIAVDANGNTGDVELSGCPGGSFYLTVTHLNHVKVITNTRINLDYITTCIVNLAISSDSHYVSCYGISPLHAEPGSKLSLKGGNANGDLYVNASGDFIIWLAANGSIPGSGNWDARADFNGNSAVNSADYSVWLGENGSISFVPAATLVSGLGRMNAGALQLRTIELGSGSERYLEVEVYLAAGQDDRLLAVDAAIEYDPRYLGQPELMFDKLEDGTTNFSLGLHDQALPHAYHYSRGALPGQEGAPIEAGENVIYALQFPYLPTAHQNQPMVGLAPGFDDAYLEDFGLASQFNRAPSLEQLTDDGAEQLSQSSK